jgi:RNA polymerase sigma-70 factor, ECF subfamily
MDDRDLVLMFQSGKDASFTTLVERHQRAVLGTALQVLKSREEAEDVAQEAFVKVYQILRHGETVEFLPYVRKIAANLALDRLRRFDVATRHLEKERSSVMDLYHESAEEVTIRRQEQGALRAMIASLPPMYAEVIVLHYAAGLSYHEIAARLGQPMSLVKNRLFRGKKLLKDLYENAGGVPYEVQ